MQSGGLLDRESIRLDDEVELAARRAATRVSATVDRSRQSVGQREPEPRGRARGTSRMRRRHLQESPFATLVLPSLAHLTGAAHPRDCSNRPATATLS